MTEKRLYSNKEMILVYASLVTVSIITTLPMLLHVFMLDTVDFKCITKDEILSRNRQNVTFCAVKTSSTQLCLLVVGKQGVLYCRVPSPTNIAFFLC